MDGTRFLRALMLVSIALAMAAATYSQPPNLLLNRNADEGGERWRFFFEGASVEHGPGRNPHFALRNGLSIIQIVRLPQGSAGKYAVLIGRASSDKADNATRKGLPVLFADTRAEFEPGQYTVTSTPVDHQWMPPRSARPEEWVTVTGRFQIREGTVAIKFGIGISGDPERKPATRPAARFDDLGLYLFGTEEEADLFVRMYNDGLR